MSGFLWEYSLDKATLLDLIFLIFDNGTLTIGWEGPIEEENVKMKKTIFLMLILLLLCQLGFSQNSEITESKNLYHFLNDGRFRTEESKVVFFMNFSGKYDFKGKKGDVFNFRVDFGGISGKLFKILSISPGFYLDFSTNDEEDSLEKGVFCQFDGPICQIFKQKFTPFIKVSLAHTNLTTMEPLVEEKAWGYSINPGVSLMIGNIPNFAVNLGFTYKKAKNKIYFDGEGKLDHDFVIGAGLTIRFYKKAEYKKK